MKTAIIIGAGPAGLTAAYELLERTDIVPIVCEASDEFGGIARTVNYKGNRMDIGGHRFFSKSDRVMNWWKDAMPLQKTPEKEIDPNKTDSVMLIRNRLSRIFFLRRFFDYPVSLNADTIANLGLTKIFIIGLSYLKARIFPIRNEKSLEDFFINRFGRRLYLLFFKDYTEKVWGVPCSQIKPEWGAQRVKGLSIRTALLHMIKQMWKGKGSVSQKDVETSLIQQFLYPKFGPGQIWEEIAKKIAAKGGQIYTKNTVEQIIVENNAVTSVICRTQNGEKITRTGDYFFSTMPIKDLVSGMSQKPKEILDVANGLQYRDFITVGLLLKKLSVKDKKNRNQATAMIPDNWIYIQERDVKIGRLQVFNNWSPYLVKDPSNVWLGLEYFCTEGDELWSKKDDDFIEFAISELEKIDFISKDDVIDSTLIREKKAYPAYFGSYEQFPKLRSYLDTIGNLILIGRNGMHRYNNQDHSMLTAMNAVDGLANGFVDKNALWNINTEQDYHEGSRGAK